MSSTVQYTDMKDSGIKWIGSVPSHWHLHTLYQLVRQVKNKNKDLQEQNLLSLSYGKIKRKDINTKDGLLPASFDGYNIIEAGDIVLRLTDLQNDHTSLLVGQATERGIITSAYTTLRPINLANSRYLYYLIHAFDLKKGFYGMGSGVRQGLNYDELKGLQIVIPSQTEQDAIATYLNEQCSKIDDLIQEAKGSIEDYKKWKQSLVFHAVTKGIDYSACMRDSGITWIGRVPCNWQIRKIKSGFVIYSGATPKSEKREYWNGDIVWITPADYKTEDKYVSEGRKMLTQEGYQSCGTSIVPSGSIIFSKRAPVGTVAINTVPLCTNQGCLSCVPTEDTDSEFFYYSMSVFTEQFELFSSGTTFKEISASAFSDFLLPFPSVSEQREIAAYLRTKCAIIDALRKEKQDLIEELELYKRSLIYETVTGKRKVV